MPKCGRSTNITRKQKQRTEPPPRGLRILNCRSTRCRTPDNTTDTVQTHTGKRNDTATPQDAYQFVLGYGRIINAGVSLIAFGVTGRTRTHVDKCHKLAPYPSATVTMFYDAKVGGILS